MLFQYSAEFLNVILLFELFLNKNCLQLNLPA